MNIKKTIANIFIATTILITGVTTFQTTYENQTANAAVNYYNKNQCTWYVFNKRASVGKPVPIVGAMLNIGITKQKIVAIV